MTKWIAFFVVIFALIVLPLRANAETPAKPDPFVVPSWADLVRTLVRLKAIDLDDDLLLNEFAAITECKLYQNFYSNDFKWNKVRLAVKDDAAQNSGLYPTAYHFDVKLQLDRYNFRENLFRFMDKATINNINTMVIYDVVGPACGKADIQYLPRTFRVVFDTPIYVPGLPLDQKAAQDLLNQMNEDQNNARIIYTRFNFHIVYIEPLRKYADPHGVVTDTRYTQSDTNEHRGVRLDSRLDSIDFFEDEAMSKFVYEYKP